MGTLHAHGGLSKYFKLDTGLLSSYQTSLTLRPPRTSRPCFLISRRCEVRSLFSSMAQACRKASVTCLSPSERMQRRQLTR